MVDDDDTPHVRASLLIDRGPEAAAAGSTRVRRVGVLFDLEPGWHLYWKNPGETGLAPELDWQVESSVSWNAQVASVHETQWPVPVRFAGSGSGIVSYGYAEQVLLASDVSGVGASAHFQVDGSVLICKDECIPVDFSLERADEAGEAAADQKKEEGLFEHYRQRVPREPGTLGISLSAAYSRADLQPGDGFEAAIAIESCDSSRADCDGIVAAPSDTFFPDEETDEVLSFEVLGSDPHPTRKDVSVLRIRGNVESDSDESPMQIAGVLRLATREGAMRAVEVRLPFPARGSPDASGSMEVAPAWLDAGASPPPVAEVVQPAASSTAIQWLRILLLALVGGLILNGMPCVLPVLGIKICSAAEIAQHDPRELRRHGLAYLAGVLASMAALAIAVISLKAAGASVGWGFQFQEPMFVAVVAVIVVLFALNLFGVFEIQIATSRLSEVGANAQGPTRSFFDGLLAVVLATPCTAPFLGTAVGFAFAGGATLIFATFIAIGAGLAAPYTLVCMIPGWSRYVPRAGGWMLRLRAGLGFLLLATAVWLLWIFGRTAGVDGQAALLGVLVALSFGVWLFGWIQTQARPTATVAAGLALVVFGGVAINKIDVTSQPPAAQAGDEAWADYDPIAISGALDAGEPVFVSFTADWCITCKVNERGVLADPEVRNALDRHGFRWFRGDWTQRDELIRTELARHGRAGVPLYLVYDPRNPTQPQVLPELLSVDLVVEAFVSARQSGNREGQTVGAQGQPSDPTL